MPIAGLLGFGRPVKPLTSAEGHRVLERDHYRCQYCGLDGMSSFENSLIMGVDFVYPRERMGRRHASNLVASCRACHTIKGRHVFHSLDEARKYVLQRREELRREWEERMEKLRKKAAAAAHSTA